MYPNYTLKCYHCGQPVVSEEQVFCIECNDMLDEDTDDDSYLEEDT